MNVDCYLVTPVLYMARCEPVSLGSILNVIFSNPHSL